METEYDNKIRDAELSIQELKEENKKIHDDYDTLISENRIIKNYNIAIGKDKKNEERMKAELILITGKQRIFC